ncbi:VCBS repeat-containing protein [Massilia sp. CFBP9026]|uniref:FG-GAP repeat domain-containing protein n=1 Tax=Massilia sp. CFBP9026 TaxID=3096536 RepID=UPI002A6B012B|nr:VCBS repeat-containing protein [Massilia sp. CFBP9026]MDY0963279.1 VCBS repeat-containing protein [Massilia sp. CFBP9026]
MALALATKTILCRSSLKTSLANAGRTITTTLFIRLVRLSTLWGKIMSSAIYDFSFDSFQITNTRSRHTDTDFVTFSVTVGSKVPLTAVKYMGDLNNGTYKPGLVFRGVVVGDGETVVVSYLIVNKGHTAEHRSKIEQDLEKAARELGSKAAQAASTAAVGAAGAAIGAALGTGIFPIVGTAIGALTGWLVSKGAAFGIDLIFANCDGPVAGAAHPFTSAQLRQSTDSDKPHSARDDTPGTDSPTGCGSNSHYYVNWSVRKVGEGQPDVVPRARPGASQRSGDVDGDGKAELFVTSAWGLGMLKQTGATMASPIMAPNGTRFGDWLLNTGDNTVGPVADYDGDGNAEILMTSPWGIGILKLAGGTLASRVMAPNTTRFGDWALDTAVTRLLAVGDLDGDGQQEIVATSPSGIAILKLTGATLTPLMVADNVARVGDWSLDTVNDQFGPIADYDGDGSDEILVSSAWGVGILKLAGGTLQTCMMAPNGTRFGGWVLDTSLNRFGPAGDYDGDGRAETLVTSAWGLALLKLTGGTLDAPMMQPSGTRFGGWLVDGGANRFGPAADYDGDGKVELLVTSAWGIGILKQAGNTMTSSMLAPNGTQFGAWLLDSSCNRFGLAADYDGDGRDEILVTSPWGIGILKLNGDTLGASMLAANGTGLGDWAVDARDEQLLGQARRTS